MSSARWIKSLTLLAMCLGLFMPQLDTTVVNLALPGIQKSLHTNIDALQWIIDSYNLTFASLLLLGGTLSDLFGRRRIFLIGLTLFTSGSLLCGFATTFPLLLIGRVLQGVGAALELPGTLSILTITYPDPKERERAIGIWASMAGIALGIGPTAGAFLVDTLGWQSIFFMNIPIGFLALVITVAIVGESFHPEGRRVDLPGQALVAFSLMTLTYAVIEGQAWGWSSPLIIGGLILAALCLVGFIQVEQRTRAPMIPLDIFKQRTFSATLTIASMMTFGMYGMLFLISLYLQSVRYDSALLAGLQLLPLSITFIIASPAAGRLMSRTGPRLLMTIGMTLMGGGILLFATLTPETAYNFLVVVMALIGIGVGFTMGPVLAVAVGSVSHKRSGMASGLANVARMLGATLGVAALGSILASHLVSKHGSAPFIAGLHAAFLVGGCIELLGAVLAIFCIPQMMSRKSQEIAAEQIPVSPHV
jgi:DHA2 family methylenomycin A resistance protein-like MFS transporter